MQIVGLPLDSDQVLSLPSPQWEYLGQNADTLDDGFSFFGDQFGVRAEPVDQSLIDNGELFIQRGKLTDASVRRDSNTGALRHDKGSINWWSSFVGGIVVSGTQYGGGLHNGVNKDRPNMIQVTSQGMLTKELPYSAFFAMTSIQFYNGNDASPITISKMVRMKGTKIRQVRDPVNYLPGGSDYNKVPAISRTKVMNETSFFARFVVVKPDGKKIFGPISEPLNIQWTGHDLQWNERMRHWEENGSQLQAHLTIGEKYRV